MPPIRWNDSFISLRCVINNIEDFFEVFISAFSDHRILRFSMLPAPAADACTIDSRPKFRFSIYSGVRSAVDLLLLRLHEFVLKSKAFEFHYHRQGSGTYAP